VRLLRELVSLMPAAESANRLRRSWYWRMMKDLLFDGTDAPRAGRLFVLTDLTRDPPVARPVYTLSPLPLAPDGTPRFPALPSCWEAAETDGERWRWALRCWAAVDEVRARRAACELAAYIEMNFGPRRLPPDLLETLDFSALADDETFFFRDGAVRKIRLPAPFDRMKLLERARAWEALGDACLLRRQSERALGFYREMAAPGAAVRRKIEQLVLPLVRLEPAVAGTTARPFVFEATVRNATNLLCALERRDEPAEALRWSVPLPSGGRCRDRRLTLTAPRRLPAGTYRLTLTVPGGNREEAEVDLFQQARLTVTGLSPTEETLIVDAETGRPVGGSADAPPSPAVSPALSARTFAVTDRTRYRPGERLRGAFWRFLPQTDAPAAHRSLTVTLVNPFGDTAAALNVRTDAGGGARFLWPLATDAAPGEYGLIVGEDPAPSAYFRVGPPAEGARAVPPGDPPPPDGGDWSWLYGPSPRADAAQPLTLLPDRPFYAPGESAAVTVRAPAGTAAVFCKIRAENPASPVETIRLTAGTARLTVPVTASDRPALSLAAWAVCRGRAYRAQLSLRVPPRGRIGRCDIALPSRAAPGATVTASVRLLSADGTPQKGPAVFSFSDAAAAGAGSVAPSLAAAFWRRPRTVSFSVRASSDVPVRPLRAEGAPALLDLWRLAVYGAGTYDVAPAAEFLTEPAAADVPSAAAEPHPFALWRELTPETAVAPGVWRLPVTLPDASGVWRARVWSVAPDGCTAEASALLTAERGGPGETQHGRAGEPGEQRLD
jgi:hypothetical protein